MLRSIEIGKKEGKLIAGGMPDYSRWRFLPGANRLRRCRSKRRHRAGGNLRPVLALIKVASFEEGLARRQRHRVRPYRLHLLHDREHLNRARRDFHVGNLYFTASVTGAMVGAHPFGGFNMSGTDSKAGGPIISTSSPRPRASRKTLAAVRRCSNPCPHHFNCTGDPMTAFDLQPGLDPLLFGGFLGALTVSAAALSSSPHSPSRSASI